MSRNERDLDRLLDETLAELRDEKLEPAVERETLARVWSRVSAESVSADATAQHIRDCGDFQALIPAYVQGALNDAKTLLVADHVAECVGCRRALKRARAERPSAAAPAAARPAGRMSTWGWRIAAAAAVLVAVTGLSLNTRVLKVRAGGMIHIDTVEGELLRVSDAASRPVAPGEDVMLAADEELRTTKGSRAMLRLADASAVEMGERAGLRVEDERWLWNRRAASDAVIKLDRGSVIVEASDQGSGHLFVETRDSKVAVTGTVFSVNHGVKGTRVSVLEGRVEVAHSGANDVLNPGDQVTTRPELARVELADEIAWSGNLERHLALIGAMTELSRELDRALAPGQRFGTRLLDLAPASTLVYAGVPNVSGSLDEAYAILEQKTQESEALRAWWQENVVATGADVHLREMAAKVHAIGETLGEEVVITLQREGQNDVVPLILAELADRASFRATLERELAATTTPDGSAADHVCIVEGDLPTGPAACELTVWIHDDLVAVTPNARFLEGLGTPVEPGSSAALFRERLHELYETGVEWVVGVDMETILGAEERDPEAEALGLLDMQHLIAERESRDGKTENRIVLSFGQTRRGIASWLDQPAPVGALDFVSPNATLAAAFVMRDPAEVLDEVFGTLSGDAETELERFETETGVSVRDDFAAPLGGEFAFALDGPLLPVPSWKLAVEVYDPARLQHTIEWLVAQAQRVATEHGKLGFALSAETVGGRTFHTLQSLDTGLSAHYTVSDGYLVAGPSRGVLEDALSTRASGITLARAGSFTRLLPSDGEPNFSGVVYQNLGALVGPLARLGASSLKLSPEQAQMAQELARRTEPSLVLAYGEMDRITFVYTHEGGFLSSGLASFFSLRSLMDVPELLRQARPAGEAQASPAAGRQRSG